jgi:hypothetical protein
LFLNTLTSSWLFSSNLWTNLETKKAPILYYALKQTKHNVSNPTNTHTIAFWVWCNMTKFKTLQYLYNVLLASKCKHTYRIMLKEDLLSPLSAMTLLLDRGGLPMATCTSGGSPSHLRICRKKPSGK